MYVIGTLEAGSVTRQESLAEARADADSIVGGVVWEAGENGMPIDVVYVSGRPVHLHVTGAVFPGACGAWPDTEDIELSKEIDDVTCEACLSEAEGYYADDEVPDEFESMPEDERFFVEQSENYNDRYAAWRAEY